MKATKNTPEPVPVIVTLEMTLKEAYAFKRVLGVIGLKELEVLLKERTAEHNKTDRVSLLATVHNAYWALNTL